MFQAMISILIIIVFAALLYWVIDAIPLQQPLNRWAKIAIVFVAVLAFIYVLLGLGGIAIPR